MAALAQREQLEQLAVAAAKAPARVAKPATTRPATARPATSRPATIRHRARRAHRDFRLTMTTTIIVVALFTQAIVALLLCGMALTASHRADALGDATSGEIGKINEQIALTQREIAALGSPSQVKQWAQQKGWALASPQAFDTVSQPASLSTQEPNNAERAAPETPRPTTP